MEQKIIEFKNITKTFLKGKLIANDNISFSVKRGEIHAIAGENGAGKSTLLSILFGLYHPDKGQIFVRNKLINYRSAADAIKDGLGMVQQHFQLVDKYNVGENILLGKEVTKYHFLAKKEAFAKINQLSKMYNFGIKAEEKITNLTVGQHQKTEILKLLYSDVEIFIFDEPTAMLTPQEIDHFLKIMKLLKQKGKTIILITHKLEEIKAVADRVSVIRQGKFIGQLTNSEISAKKLSTLMVGEKIAETKKQKVEIGSKILEVQNLTIRKKGIDKVKNVSFNVNAGEILAIAGVEGNGQTELVNGILGLHKINHGEINLFSKSSKKQSQKIALSKLSISKRNDYLSSIPEDRHKYGMVLDLKVYENMTLKTFWKDYSFWGFLKRFKMQKESLKILDQYDVRGTNKGFATTRNLSGGNQQKAVVGREIALNKDLLIIFQATRGLDVKAIEYIHQQILLTAKNHKAILLISYDLNEIIKLADRVLVFNTGKVTGELVGKEIKREKLGVLMASKEGGQNAPK